MKTFFKGKNIEEMTREELIEAVITLGRLYNSSLSSMKSLNDTWCEIARARNH